MIMIQDTGHECEPRDTLTREAAFARVRCRLKQKPDHTILPEVEPLYDDVFHQGVEWMDRNG